jgi:glucose/arabinose dehydrogenase
MLSPSSIITGLDHPLASPSTLARTLNIFMWAAKHGSLNRRNRAGYEVTCIPMHNGHADGSYEDFLTGFITKEGQVWGRPVGVAIAKDGSMFVTDDGSRSV